jgi:hypothetical protein
VQFLDVGVILAFRQDARDHAPLVGDAQAPFRAEGFDVDRLVHVLPG